MIEFSLALRQSGILSRQLFSSGDREVVLQRMRIADPAAIWLARSFFSSAATWGLAYGMIALDPLRFRDFAWLGVISKLLYFTIYAVAFQQGRLTREAYLPGPASISFLAILFARGTSGARQAVDIPRSLLTAQ
jgi:hypothetical protein